MTRQAAGAFDVALAPAAPPDEAEGLSLGRMTLDKRFHGDLEGVSKGQMLTSGSAGGSAGGSAAYVAIERVVGTLQGRKGAFALVHRGFMTPESRSLVVEIAPGSGQGALAGISGAMTIEITDGKHLYTLDYSLAE